MRRSAALAGHAGEEPTARELLRHGSGAVRATALGALARMGRLTAADAVLALGDPDPEVRRRACEAAVPLADVDLVPALADPDSTVVETACWALGERGEEAGRPAVAALSQVATSSADALCREAAVAALGAIGHDDGRPAVLAAMEDKAAVRRRATLALAAFTGPEVDRALHTALTDRDRQVRQAAEDLLGDG
jgi:HEAT repeat protein